jgi:hypothetical protein
VVIACFLCLQYRPRWLLTATGDESEIQAKDTYTYMVPIGTNKMSSRELYDC